jgi:ribulose-phosphate 3-epimerase
MSEHPGVLVSASILNADYGRLDRVVHKMERAGVDRLHLDVMDGHFVPNISFGPDVVAAFRRLTTLPLDVHLMISEPSRYVDRFIDAGVETITFHVEVPETEEQKVETLARIRAAGRGPGLAISPRTPVSVLEPHASELDLVMVLTVEPGWGGQAFMPDAASRIEGARALLARAGRGALVHVDGGVNRDTAYVVGAYGVDVCIVGSVLFQRGRDASDEVRAVRERALAGVRAGPGSVRELGSPDSGLLSLADAATAS